MRLRTAIRTRLGNATLGLLSLVVFFGIAEILIAVVFPGARYVVRPSAIIANSGDLLTSEMWGHIVGTFLRTVGSFAIATITGITLGVLLGRSRLLSLVLQPIVNLFRPIPSSILIPLLLSMPGFGFSELTRGFTVVFGALWPILINTSDAVRHPHPTSLDVVRQLRLSRFNRLRYFTLPQAASPIFSGMKISLSICLILAVTAEILVGGETFGLGYLQEASGKDGNYILMYLITFVVACLGLALNSAFSRTEALHPWLKHKSDEVLGRQEGRI